MKNIDKSQRLIDLYPQMTPCRGSDLDDIAIEKLCTRSPYFYDENESNQPAMCTYEYRIPTPIYGVIFTYNLAKYKRLYSDPNYTFVSRPADLQMMFEHMEESKAACNFCHPAAIGILRPSSEEFPPVSKPRGTSF